MKEITLHTPRLCIRSLHLTDLSDFHSYRSNPEVTKYQGFDVMTIEQAEEFIIRNAQKDPTIAGEWKQYAICHRDSNRLLGDCALRFLANEPRIAEIGMTISHFEQKKGFAKEAMLGLLEFLFQSPTIHRVVEIVDAENSASIQLLKSLGFRQEGHFIENIFFKGKWGSEYQFAMLKKEWQSMHPKH